MILEVAELSQAAATQGQQLAGFRVFRVTTGSIAASGTAEITVTWPVPYLDNSYTVSVTVEDPDHMLTVRGWSKLPAGAGIVAIVANPDGTHPHTGDLNVITKGD